jgi:hypothetical protein
MTLSVLYTKYVKNIFSFYDETEPHYGLKILFELNQGFLLFDAHEFSVVYNNSIFGLYKWNRLISYQIEENLYIDEIKNDEWESHFIKLSNDDIIYVHQFIYGYGDWHEDFEFVLKSDTEHYREVYEYMNEEWVTQIILT